MNRKRFSLGVAGAVAALLALLAPGARAQVFEVRGGSSTMLETHGGSLVLYGQNYTARVGLGWTDEGLRSGFQFTMPWRGLLLDLGDQAIPFVLPTDVQNNSYAFFGRGAGVTRKTGRSTLFVFGGVTSQYFSTPFVSSAKADTAAGAVYFDRQLTGSLRFSSRNILSRTQTSIQALEWKPRENLTLAAAGGMGSNQPYWSTSLDYHRNWISLQAGYSRAGDTFRRVRVRAPQLSESDRETLRIELRPRRWLGFNVHRQNYLAADPAPGSNPRIGVTGVGAWGVALDTRVHGSWFRSRGEQGGADSLIFGGRRQITSRLEAGADYLHSKPERGEAVSAAVVTLRETLTRRLMLTQVISLGEGQRSVAFGGHFSSNRLTLGVDYQTVFTPLLTPGRTQFRQVLGLTVRVQLPRNLQANLDTQVSPLGETRYSAHMSSYLYRGFGVSPNGVPSGAFSEYVVRGRVRDEKGQPVNGAALWIGSELVFTDSRGTFFLRVKKAREYSLQVALDQFTLPGRYEVVAAPASVRAVPEDQIEFAEIVLRRLPLRRPAPAPEAPGGPTDGPR